MSRLEGKKSNASVWIIAAILILAVAAVLYFLFARPATQTPIESVPEPVPSVTEPAPQETEPTPMTEVDPNAPLTPAPDGVEPGIGPDGATPGETAPGVENEFATPVPGTTPESLGPDNAPPAPPSDTIESL